MHNIHLIIVNARTGLDALTAAESFVEGWGDENNWRSFIAAIPSKKGGRIVYGDDNTEENIQKINTIAKINKLVDSLVINSCYKDSFDRVVKAVRTGKKLKDDFDWYSAGTYCHQMHEMVKKNKPFNVLRDSYCAGSYDEFGVTHFVNDPKAKKWVVVMDMHS